MKIFYGKQKGDILIEVDSMVTGEVTGDIVVLPGAHLDLSASVEGNVTLMRHSKASIRGPINGNLYDEGGTIELFSIISGDVVKSYGIK
ncbi:hypothetical protein BKP37_08285 [Anaerobacillus alkalilacustris]|uniref:Cell shape determination protein CcmA n=1 Tax=Anaerobacillus alkalilacustris TaxID=393763 RepID=A0A1S2LRP7_9BACI|nr:hypothetical protein [Anaerobacillus alkalilacustris]OIJ14337.1 hypothetical protein BKP37_08285 [Anaerobacillus alkalilacustris]